MARSSPERIADTSMASGETMLEAARDKSINSSFLVRWAFSSGLGLSRLRGTVRCTQSLCGREAGWCAMLGHGADHGIRTYQCSNRYIGATKEIILARGCESLDARKCPPGLERPWA